jgi:anti-sigma-K factor RskA
MSEERDALAGEYVLGLLSEAEAAALEAEAASDPELARTIAFWRARLDPLTDQLAPATPTRQLWARIAADTTDSAGMPPVAPRRAAPGDGWRKTAVASLLLAASLAAFIVWSRVSGPSPAPAFTAVALLAAPGSLQPSVRVQVLHSGEMTMVPLRKLAVAEGRQMDLWAWPREEKAPVLLGAVSEDGGAERFAYPPREGTPVMITDEKRGSGIPATPGPTLYAGLLVVPR